MVYKTLRSFFVFGICTLIILSGAQLFAAQTQNDPERNDMLDAASVEVGHSIAQTCNVCHTFDRGGPNQVGPNLFGIMGAHMAANKTYIYSDALKKMGDQIWTVDAMDKWLLLPGAYISGTKMHFGGLLDPQDRADVIAYLKTLR